MKTKPRLKKLLIAVLSVVLIAGIVEVIRGQSVAARTRITAYFNNSNGIYPGDDVLILGVKVGKIDKIEPQPTRAKISFWVNDKYKVPANARAVIISPQLVTARAIQLTPAYTTGPALADNAVIPQSRTAVPVEFDDLRKQLQKVSDALQPTQPDGTSPLGKLINTAANNLRGQGQNIRDATLELSRALSALGDHSDDIFSSAKNLATLVSALQSSADLMRQLNVNLASVTGALANDPDEIGQAVADIDATTADLGRFIADNKEALGTTSDKLTSVTNMMVASLDEVKQILHVAPNVAQNVSNIFYPAHGSLTGILAVNQFSNTIGFICGAVQAASRLNADQSSKLCAQYLAPIIKNRQYSYLPLGINPVVGAMARPNELTYSEDWLRPDHRPSPPAAAPAPDSPPPPPELPVASPVNTPVQPTKPADGLPGLMVPPAGGTP
ncbi:MCE family protein [Mycobacterium palustre]|uniref:MCE family protein n=1 Tax=Mycobacterium palustre TaxID=153971 RepID=UPI000A154F91|nr:MCE family protein [Mycobacterium palustre]MCV7100423.1 MCE family protein [Mycobacterium palustre]